jgi:hypothetical protein
MISLNMHSIHVVFRFFPSSSFSPFRLTQPHDALSPPELTSPSHGASVGSHSPPLPAMGEFLIASKSRYFTSSGATMEKDDRYIASLQSSSPT